MTSMGQVLPWNLGSGIVRGAILQSTVIVRFSLSTATPADLSSAWAAGIVIRQITQIINSFFMGMSSFEVGVGRNVKQKNSPLITLHSILISHGSRVVFIPMQTT